MLAVDGRVVALRLGVAGLGHGVLENLSREFLSALQRAWELLPRGSCLPHHPHHNTTVNLLFAAGAPPSPSPKMTYQLPPMLLNLFAPRPPLRWVEPSDHAPEKRCTPKIGGVAEYLQAMREYKDNDGYQPSDSWLQKRDRKKIEKKEKQEQLLTEASNNCTLCFEAAIFQPHADTTTQTNPAKTPRCRATLLRRCLSRASRTASHLMISSANLAATVPLSVSALLRTRPLRPTRHQRRGNAATHSLSTSARRI